MLRDIRAAVDLISIILSSDFSSKQFTTTNNALIQAANSAVNILIVDLKYQLTITPALDGKFLRRELKTKYAQTYDLSAPMSRALQRAIIHTDNWIKWISILHILLRETTRILAELNESPTNLPPLKPSESNPGLMNPAAA